MYEGSIKSNVCFFTYPRFDWKDLAFMYNRGSIGSIIGVGIVPVSTNLACALLNVSLPLAIK